jgi:hypothetical protein
VSLGTVAPSVAYLRRHLGPAERLTLAYSLCELEFDPSPYLMVLMFKKSQSEAVMVSLDEAFELLKNAPIALFKFNMMNHVDLYVREMSYENYLTFRPIMNGPFLSLDVDGGIPKDANSFIGCLYRRAAKDGYRLVYETKPTNIPSINGLAHVFIVSAVRP